MATSTSVAGVPRAGMSAPTVSPTSYWPSRSPKDSTWTTYAIRATDHALVAPTAPTGFAATQPIWSRFRTARTYGAERRCSRPTWPRLTARITMSTRRRTRASGSAAPVMRIGRASSAPATPRRRHVMHGAASPARMALSRCLLSKTMPRHVARITMSTRPRTRSSTARQAARMASGVARPVGGRSDGRRRAGRLRLVISAHTGSVSGVRSSPYVHHALGSLSSTRVTLPSGLLWFAPKAIFLLTELTR